MPVKSKTNIMATLFEGSQATEITKRLFGARGRRRGGSGAWVRCRLSAGRVPAGVRLR